MQDLKGPRRWRPPAWVSGRTLAGAALVAALAGSLAGPSGSGADQKVSAAAAVNCQPVSPGGPLFVTSTCVDPMLAHPYTDLDQERTTTDPSSHVTVSYRYVHGGFKGTNARFSLYFPPPSRYRGRFFESTYPTVSQEDATPDTIAFALSEGAYAVSTNNDGGVQVNSLLGGYRVNAASAKYSRQIAQRIYGKNAATRGYLYGASGGAYQTVSAMESTDGVWQGAVPMVFGVPNAIPSFMTVELLALRILHDQLPEIADATEPGGSGNPYAGLDPEQSAVLREVTLLGFPPRGWWQYAALSGGAFTATEGGVRAFDSTYASDFWTDPGYEGAQPSVQAARIQQDATVESLVGTPTRGLVLSSVPTGDLVGADLDVESGAAAGKILAIGSVAGNTIGFADGSDTSLTSAIAPGDQVRMDNSWLVALEYYQRHQVPGPDQYGWNQYRNAQGSPIYPQRPVLVGPTFSKLAGGSVPDGHFHGKMIMLGSVMDVQAYPWSEDWYQRQARAVFGPRLGTVFRHWYMDNADHDPTGPAALAGTAGGPASAAAPAADHIVAYTGEVQQALLDLDAWVQHGTPPPPSTSYRVDSQDQIQLAATAARRHGLQPVVTLSAELAGGPGSGSSGGRIETVPGRPVIFNVRAQVPPGTGKLVKVEWDFEGTGSFRPQRHLRIGSRVDLRAAHTFGAPGTYFAVVRVTSQRQGDQSTPWGLVQNLATVRVVVR